jgi:hypothetical protein
MQWQFPTEPQFGRGLCSRAIHCGRSVSGRRLESFLTFALCVFRICVGHRDVLDLCRLSLLIGRRVVGRPVR